MKTSEWLEEAKAKLEELKSKFEEMNMKTALGKNEMRDAFEREWSRFSQFVDEQQNRLRRQAGWADPVFKHLEDALQQLKDLLRAPEPDNAAKFALWREQVIRNIHEAEFAIQQLRPVLEDDEKELCGALRVKLEIYRTHLAITPFEKLSALGAEAEAVEKAAGEVLAWRIHEKEMAAEKMKRFGENIGASLDHMKKAFTELIRK